MVVYEIRMFNELSDCQIYFSKPRVFTCELLATFYTRSAFEIDRVNANYNVVFSFCPYINSGSDSLYFTRFFFIRVQTDGKNVRLSGSLACMRVIRSGFGALTCTRPITTSPRTRVYISCYVLDENGKEMAGTYNDYIIYTSVVGSRVLRDQTVYF